MFSGKKIRTMLLIAVVILTPSLLPKSASATIEGDLELLKLAANGYKANLAKLATWQGKAIVSTDYCSVDTANKSPLKTIKRKSSVEFLFDAGRDAVRWYWNRLEEQVTQKDMQPVAVKPYFTSGIVKDKTLYKLFPVPPTPERPPGRVLIRPLSSIRGSIRGFNDEFHPMFYFQSTDENWYKALMFYYKKANSPTISNGRVWKKGNIIYFEKVSKRTPVIITYHEFDLLKGCCITKYSRRYDPKAHYSMAQVTWNLDYEEVDGVFVPKDVTWSTVNSDGSEKTTRVVQFVQNVTNRLIEAEEFSLAKLRLIPGDIVQDSATGVTFKYNDPEALFEDSDFPTDVVPTPDQEHQDTNVSNTLQLAKTPKGHEREGRETEEPNAIDAEERQDTSSRYPRTIARQRPTGLTLFALGVAALLVCSVAFYVYRQRTKKS